jgi:hypothetical protein
MSGVQTLVGEQPESGIVSPPISHPVSTVVPGGTDAVVTAEDVTQLLSERIASLRAVASHRDAGAAHDINPRSRVRRACWAVLHMISLDLV